MTLRAQVEEAGATTSSKSDREQSQDAPQHQGQSVAAPISLCMIVKDRIETLRECIDSARPYVAEVNVYDTGSTDGTLELLDRMEAEPGSPIRVECGTWRDDFAWARNQSFAMASPEIPWWTWLDSDDVLLRGDLLVELVAEMERRNAPGAIVGYDYMGSGINAEFQPFLRVARAHSISWRGVVHEQWRFCDEIRKGRTSERLPELVVVEPPLLVRHRRHDHDAHRYTALMREAAEDLERNPRVLYFLLETLVQVGEWEEALDVAQRWLETVERHEGKWTIYRSMALAFAMQAEIGLLRGDAAVARCEELVAYLRAWSEAAIEDPGFVAAPSAAERVTGLDRSDGDVILQAEGVLAKTREMAASLEQLAARSTYRAPVRPGRNDPCPCGSGRKYKKCCLT